MKRPKTITKKNLIKILMKEPLYNDSGWINVLQDDDPKKCHACAVGAVVRHILNGGATSADVLEYALRLNDGVDSGGSDEASAFLNVCAANYWTALSSRFEYMMQFEKNRTQKGTMKVKAKRELVQFVQDYFPERINF